VSVENADMLLVVGTYTTVLPHVRGRGQGIHLLGFDSRSGTITPGPAFGGVVNPTWLTVSRDRRRLYSVQERDATDGAAVDCFALEGEARRLTHLASAPSGGSWPCHLSLDAAERTLFVSNYGDGRLAILSLDAEGRPSGERRVIRHEGRGTDPERQEGPHLHQVVPTPDGQHVLLCEAGLDQIIRYPLENGRVGAAPDLLLRTDAGSFPRHLAFLPDGTGFLVTHELAGKVDAYRYDAQGAVRQGTISILPEDWSGVRSAAAIRIHPSGGFAYASNRGHDSICGIDLRGGPADLRHLGWWSAGGEAPRDFAIDPAGRFLVVANQDSDSLVVYAIDAATGALQKWGAVFSIGTPVCLCFVQLAGAETEQQK
jgi:6-phosphogluconolactonase